MGNLEHEIKDIKKKHILSMTKTNLKGCAIVSIILSACTYIFNVTIKHLLLSYKVYWELFVLYLSLYKTNFVFFLTIVGMWFVPLFIMTMIYDIQNANKIIEKKIKNKQ